MKYIKTFESFGLSKIVDDYCDQIIDAINIYKEKTPVKNAVDLDHYIINGKLKPLVVSIKNPDKEFNIKRIHIKFTDEYEGVFNSSVSNLNDIYFMFDFNRLNSSNIAHELTHAYQFWINLNKNKNIDMFINADFLKKLYDLSNNKYWTFFVEMLYFSDKMEVDAYIAGHHYTDNDNYFLEKIKEMKTFDANICYKELISISEDDLCDVEYIDNKNKIAIYHMFGDFPKYFIIKYSDYCRAHKRITNKDMLKLKNLSLIDFLKYYENKFKIVAEKAYKKLLKIDYHYDTMNESVNDNFLYHYTDINNLKSILKNNRINLSSSIGTSEDKSLKFFFLSLSRTPNAKLGYARNIDDRIVFDKNKLKNNFKVVSFDYWKRKNPEMHANNTMMNYNFEFEDRLLSDKSYIFDISKYISRIDLIYDKNSKYNKIDDIYEVITYCKKFNINVFIYKNKNDMNFGRNAIDVEDINVSGDKKEEYTSDYKRYYSFDIMLALILYDRKIMDNSDYELCADLVSNFIAKHKLGIVLSPYKVYDRMRTLYYGSRDAIEGLKADLHNIFKSGKGDEIRDVVHILTNEMNKVKATSLDEYRDYKINGLKTPKTPKKDYSKIYELFKLERKWDENHNKYMYSYVSVPNGELLKNLENFRYNTYKYMGSYTDAEYSDIVAISEKDVSVSKFINYLFNRYLPEFAIRKIEDSNFDHYEHKLLYKITKIS